MSVTRYLNLTWLVSFQDPFRDQVVRKSRNREEEKERRAFLTCENRSWKRYISQNLLMHWEKKIVWIWAKKFFSGLNKLLADATNKFSQFVCPLKIIQLIEKFACPTHDACLYVRDVSGEKDTWCMLVFFTCKFVIYSSCLWSFSSLLVCFLFFSFLSRLTDEVPG